MPKSEMNIQSYCLTAKPLIVTTLGGKLQAVE